MRTHLLVLIFLHRWSSTFTLFPHSLWFHADLSSLSLRLWTISSIFCRSFLLALFLCLPLSLSLPSSRPLQHLPPRLWILLSNTYTARTAIQTRERVHVCKCANASARVCCTQASRKARVLIPLISLRIRETTVVNLFLHQTEYLKGRPRTLRHDNGLSLLAVEINIRNIHTGCTTISWRSSGPLDFDGLIGFRCQIPVNYYY